VVVGVVEHLGLEDLDPGPAEPAAVGADLVGLAGSGHHP
jgi:hypothetical protein